MRIHSLVLVGALGSFLAACGGGATGEPKTGGVKDPAPGVQRSDGTKVSKKAAQGFQSALDRFVAVDKKGEWSASDCSSIADMFQKAASDQKAASGKAFPEALYNAGLVHARCGHTDKAKKTFQQAVAGSKDFHRARAQLALFEFGKDKNLDSAITKLEGIIRDAKFQNVEALVSVAALQMERDNEVKNKEGANDFQRAKLNIQRALAIDDSFMPAFNQLANYYMQTARKQALKKKGKKRRSRKKKKGSLKVAAAEQLELNQQQLDLAALVTAQGIRKNATYAPIHNTAGLIQVEQKNYNGAVKSFGRARRLDPKFWEAHMNYAAVNLGFRGFAEAEKAYRAAIKLRPKTFEAHLGLALALRGQINDSNFSKMVAEAEKHLAEAKKIAPNRAETYYNQAILTQEYKAKSGNQSKDEAALESAAKIYKTFVQKAGSDPEFAQAVKISTERSEDITAILQFMRDGRAQAKKDAAAAAAKKKAPPAKKP